MSSSVVGVASLSSAIKEILPLRKTLPKEIRRVCAGEEGNEGVVGESLITSARRMSAGHAEVGEFCADSTKFAGGLGHATGLERKVPISLDGLLTIPLPL